MSGTSEKGPLQLVFDLPLRPASGLGDFLVSQSNAAAVELIDRWPDWPQPGALLAGEAACGKSHLAMVWQAQSQAVLYSAQQLNDAAVEVFQRDDIRAIVVEDIDRGIGDQRVLFHLLNLARETKRFILLTSRVAPGDLEIELPDLRSRLRALPVISILAPDDGLLSAVLVKMFADRQIGVEPSIINYLIRHMDRSMECARSVVASVDTLALARQRKVTRAIAAEALAALNPDRAK